MTICYPAGELRAYLDGELPAADASAVQTHLDTCAACRAQVEELESVHTQVGRVLAATTVAGVATETAWSRVQAQLGAATAEHSPKTLPTRLAIRQGPRRRVALGAATAAAVLLVALLVPSVRAVADQVLQIFRAQSVVYISVSPSRIAQLEQLQSQLQGQSATLFLSQPKEIGAAPQAQQVSSVQAAESLAGFKVKAPGVLPGNVQSSSIDVRGQSSYQLQVNVQTVREMLKTLGVTDVQVPDSLGAQPITITLPPLVHLQYVGPGYTLNLIEGASPTVNLPDGVDLTQLGKAALEVYGMSPQQAGMMSKQIDWASTLVFPFPLDTLQVQQVNVNGATGILFNSTGSGPGLGGVRHSSNQQAGQPTAAANAPTASQPESVLYWQSGSQFYILTGTGNGTGKTALVAAASSLR